MQEEHVLNIHESQEDYLERILMLRNEHGHVRSIDLANSLGFSKPSVSIALKKFRENGYVLVDEEGNISLTEKGEAIAEKVYERHLVLTDALIHLGVTPELARKDACKIEHDLSEETFQIIKNHIEKFKK